MNCRTARDLMLTADLADLETRSESDLSQHLRACKGCHRVATLILDAMQELTTGLSQARRADSTAARRAIAAAFRRRSRARLLRRVVPLATAAGLAGLLLVRRGPPVVPIPSRTPTAVHDVSVTAPPGRSLAVLHTDDPNIVVIWFF
jgi:hypothetical protein